MSSVAVSRRALVQRIKRRLAKEGEVLLASRSERSRQDVGDFYVVDASLNTVIERGVDLAALGRELGVLAGYEKVVE